MRENRTELVVLLSTLVDIKDKYPVLYRKMKSEVLKTYQQVTHAHYEERPFTNTPSVA
jgi:hypothetical protein